MIVLNTPFSMIILENEIVRRNLKGFWYIVKEHIISCKIPTRRIAGRILKIVVDRYVCVIYFSAKSCLRVCIMSPECSKLIYGRSMEHTQYDVKEIGVMSKTQTNREKITISGVC